MCICPFFDATTRKCKLWNTTQSDYCIKEYCLGPYKDSHTKCPNYKDKLG